ncbi:YdgA family protein [Chitinivorax sp. B]|uniref:YdgA family protein n=1 Tax=Chitinivorax sp. B TaxID=2502235 RepID=UPI0010F93666|nr:YdgA family protein [Chitinivorax sp. B]
MKKIWRGVALAGTGVVVVWFGTTWWAGTSAEQALTEQQQKLSKLPYFKLKAAAYNRGFFSSEQEVTLELSDAVTWPYQLYLRYAGKQYQPISLTYRQHIKHGPFPQLSTLDFRPYKAVVTTELLLPDDVKAKLKPFFGDKPPVNLETRIGFNNDGVITAKVPAFDYQEAISGVKIQWQGLDSQFAYNGQYNQFQLAGNIPGLKLDAAGKATVDLKALTFNGKTHSGVAGLMLGESSGKLASVAVDIKEGTAFAATLENLQYQSSTEAEGDFVNAKGRFDIGALLLEGKRYGPATLDAAARHLHAPTLAKLDQAIIALQRQPLNDEEATSKAFETLKKSGLPLLQHDPELVLNKLTIQLPEGKVNANAGIKLIGLVEQDLENPVQLLERINARADLKLPKPVVDTYVRLLIRNTLISRSGSAADITPEQVEQMDELARQLVQGQVANLIDQKMIREEGQNLAIALLWKQGKLSINGNDVPLPWQTAPINNVEKGTPGTAITQ